MSKILQSAYSCIESQKYKKAASLLESPELARFPLAKSLKCYCYVKLGNRIKVREGVEEFIKLKVTDPSMIKQVMDAIHYIGDYSLAIRLLEDAHIKDKHNIETGELLYFAYFWTKEFDKMRDLSLDLMKLYKLKKYTIWNAANVIFNTNPEDPEKYKKVMLLSEMMVKNQLKTVEIKSREGRSYQWLLMEILIREGKVEDAEKELEDRMANYVVSQRLLDERILQRSVLRELGREIDILSFLEEDMVKGLKSDWDTILYYINTTFELCLPEVAIKRLVSFEEKYCENCSTREKWLYRMEVASRAQKIPELVELVMGYCNFIGHKQCCYVDLERWLPLLKEYKEGITELTKFIVNVLNLTIFVVKGNDLLQVIQKKVTAIEIAIFLGIPINESFLKELYKTYCLMIPQYKETLSTKEILSLDYIPYLLAILLHNKALQDETPVVERLYCQCEAYALLEKHVSERPHFFLSTLALCLLNYQMGIPLEAVRCYRIVEKWYSIEQLGVKEIQMMSMCYLMEQICREWSLVKETRAVYESLNSFVYDALKESHMKQGECLQQGTYMSIKTLDDLATRLHESREPETFRTLFYINSLTAAMKDFDYLNQVCFDELAQSEQSNYRDNADRHIIRFWRMNQTQMYQLSAAQAISELSAFEKAISRFFYLFRQNDQQVEKVESHVVDSVINCASALKGKVENLSTLSYCVVSEVLKALQTKEVIEAEKQIAEYGEMMKKEVANLQKDGVYDPYCLNQINQMMNRSALWLVLLLPKNKKCSKPSPAKEPTSALIVNTLGLFLEMADVGMLNKKEYVNILENHHLVNGRFVETLSKIGTVVCANHAMTLSQIVSMKKELEEELKKKNYRLKKNEWCVCWERVVVV